MNKELDDNLKKDEHEGLARMQAAAESMKKVEPNDIPMKPLDL